MSAEWKDFQLGELATFKYGKFLAKSQLDESGFPVFSGYGIVGYLPTYQFDDPQLLIVCRGEGGTGDVKMSPSKCSITNLSIVFSPNEQIVSRKFLYWALKASDTHRLRTGSAQAQIVIGSLEKLGIVIPTDRLRQDEIARTLDALDDRITLLRETNATLEAIAQALFKSWFVDFDPVRAKLEGRSPEGMDEATARLFPDSFEESELGLVSRGWRVGTVGAFARQHKGSINPLQNPGVMYEHFSLPAFDNQQMPVSELGTEIKSNKTSVPPDAVLLSKLNPHIPRIWLPVDVGNHAVCSTEFLVFVPTPGSGASKEFIYCAFTTAKFKELLCQLVTGTSNSHQRVKPEGVSTMIAVIPSEVTLKGFASIAKPIFERIGHNRNKARTLATLRDTLLPRLISGHLRPPEAQAAAEEALA